MDIYWHKKITRKRLVKMLMGHGMPRNKANRIARGWSPLPYCVHPATHCFYWGENGRERKISVQNN